MFWKTRLSNYHYRELSETQLCDKDIISRHYHNKIIYLSYRVVQISSQSHFSLRKDRFQQKIFLLNFCSLKIFRIKFCKKIFSFFLKKFWKFFILTFDRNLSLCSVKFFSSSSWFIISLQKILKICFQATFFSQIRFFHFFQANTTELSKKFREGELLNDF